MTLVSAIGMRTVYSWAEVCEFTGLGQDQLKGLVHANKLVKRYSGAFPFDQKDVNEFLHRLNNGKIYRRQRKKHECR